MPPLKATLGTPLVGERQDFVIPLGSQNSNSIRAAGGNNGSMMVYGRDTTDGAITYAYQVSPNNIDWYALQDAAGAAVTPPTTGNAKSLDYIAGYYRIRSSAPVTANRTWDVTAEL